MKDILDRLTALFASSRAYKIAGILAGILLGIIFLDSFGPIVFPCAGVLALVWRATRQSKISLPIWLLGGVSAFVLLAVVWSWILWPLFTLSLIVTHGTLAFLLSWATLSLGELLLVGMSLVAFLGIVSRRRLHLARPIATGTVVLALALLASRPWATWRSSDGYLKKNYEQHRPELQQLVEMIVQDKADLVTVQDGRWTNYIPMQEARWGEYKRLCEQADISYGFHHHGPPIIYFAVCRGASVPGGSTETGYAWSMTPPVNETQEGHDYAWPTVSYEPLGNNWYLYKWGAG